MSTRQDRAHDAWVDAHTVHTQCGQTLDRCDCTEPEAPILCAHHEQLVAAVRAERPDADLTGLHGAKPSRMTSDVALCFDCPGAVMSFIGVGKRPEDRMLGAAR